MTMMLVLGWIPARLDAAEPMRLAVSRVSVGFLLHAFMRFVAPALCCSVRISPLEVPLQRHLFLKHYCRLAKSQLIMPHIPSMLTGAVFSGGIFLVVHQQVSHRSRLSEKWRLQGSYIPSSTQILNIIFQKTFFLTNDKNMTFEELAEGKVRGMVSELRNARSKRKEVCQNLWSFSCSLARHISCTKGITEIVSTHTSDQLQADAPTFSKYWNSGIKKVEDSLKKDP